MGQRVPAAARLGGVWGVRRLLVLGALGLCVVPILAAPASARILKPWGSSLSTTPTLDTANGASHATVDRPTHRGISPYVHDGADIALWNTLVTGRPATAPRGGQVRALRVRGCAVEDLTAPAQVSLGVPVNTIEFQTLSRQRGGSYKADVTAGRFPLPFCSNTANPATGRVSTNTVTTFRPIHMCIRRGNTVGVYGIGGFVPNSVGTPWYPQGVPLEILSRTRGSAISSFVDADISNGVYEPGARPRGVNSGWGHEPRMELMLQVVEGVGGDAYGLCPGGTAEEPTNSNAVICAFHRPYDGHRQCGRAGDRARPMLSS
jgi:hypothetical protein